MPIYEYHCAECDENFEILQKITEEHLAACPRCGKKVKRLISQTSFSLKGGGWYKDGYTSATSGGSEKPAAKSDDKKSGKTEKKTETTPAKKD